MQTSMSGICVTDDAVNLYYYLKAKSVVSISTHTQEWQEPGFDGQEYNL